MEMMSRGAQMVARDFRPLRRAEYERLAAGGCFVDEKVELLFGMVVTMPRVDPSHVQATYRLRRALEARIRDRATVYSDSAFAASDDSEPEPDVFVIPNAESSWVAHPSSALLVVEVARSSLDRDQGPKLLLYGTSRVTEYWIIDLVHGHIEVYRDPRDGRWNTKSTLRRGQTVAMIAFPDVEIPVDDLLPPE